MSQTVTFNQSSCPLVAPRPVRPQRASIARRLRTPSIGQNDRRSFIQRKASPEDAGAAGGVTRRRSMSQRSSEGNGQQSPRQSPGISSTALDEFMSIMRGSGHPASGISRPHSRTSPRSPSATSAVASLFTSPPSRNRTRNPVDRYANAETLMQAQRHLIQLLNGHSPPLVSDEKAQAPTTDDDDVEALTLDVAELEMTTEPTKTTED